MDEVNLHDSDELNELEAHLYAQIHHEPVEAGSSFPCKTEEQDGTHVPVTEMSTNAANKSGGDKTLDRYWGRVQQPAQPLQLKNEINEVSNRNHGVSEEGEQTTAAKQNKDSATTNRRTKKNFDKFTDRFKSQNQVGVRANIQLNPGSKKHYHQYQHKPKHEPGPNMRKDGPFAKQIQKLDKAMRIEAKRQKSIIAKSKMKNQIMLRETVLVESTEGSDDDVIAVPVPPPPMYVIDDSDEESKYEKIKVEIVELLSPEETNQEALDEASSSNNARRQLPPRQNDSRCVSPSSIVSSDDFIGHNDRCSLKKTSAMADDEDLIMLTADFDSLMEAPEGRAAAQYNPTLNEKRVELIVKIQDTEVATSSGAKHRTSKHIQLADFQGEDESESEADEGNQSQKNTVIRSVSSSSSDDDNDNGMQRTETALRKKTKRLNKEPLSGNRKTIRNTDPVSNHAVENFEDASAVPFIAPGPAMERCKTKSLSESQSVKRNTRRASTGDNRCTNLMADNEFIATINTLARGDCNAIEEHENENSDLSDNDEAPSARTIAEQVLKAQQKKVTKMRTSAGVVTEYSTTVSSKPTADRRQRSRTGVQTSVPSTALPDETLSNLSNIFSAIDNLDKGQRNVSDDSDYDVEVVDDSSLLRTKNSEVKEIKFKMLKETGDPVYNIVYSEEKRFGGGLGWNDEMRHFYNDSWKGEGFNVKKILNRMNPDKNLWKIYTEDRFPKFQRNNKKKCYNCCEFGHTRAKCTQPRKPLICYMCGERGHYEPRCPNTVCLRCGNKTQVYTKSCNACTFQNRLICPVCKVRGHTLNLCPDKWRRYHSTTQPNLYPNSEVEYKKKKFCCICAAGGHLSDTCRSAVRFLEYPLFVSDIKSHQKSYNDQSFKSTISGIAYNLLYKPDEDVSFELAENSTATDYYGRFLKSVGMTYLLNRKRKSDTTPGTKSKKRSANSTTHEGYVINPYSKAGTKERSTLNSSAPEQVQEISESGNVDDTEQDVVIEEATCSEETNIEQTTTAQPVAVSTTEEQNNSSMNENIEKSVSNNPKRIQSTALLAECIEEESSTTKTSNNTQTQPQPLNERTQSETTQQNEIIIMDSDSNYSFSEHFEIPQTNDSAPINKPKSKTKSREMGPLPDFIPLNNSGNYDGDDDEDSDDVDLNAGISKKYVALESEEDEDERGKRATSPLKDLPCEAKIYLTHFHSKYLLSPPGHEFLVEKSKECNIKARLDWTSVGHVLIIFGLQSNQDRFHRELLLKYRQLTDQMNKKHLDCIQKVPKRADAIIRFLRENINELMTNLGNVNELLKRLNLLEDQQLSKQNRKLDAKVRRSLNMILLGQAGLRDGNFHLDKLLLTLQKLVNNYKDEDLASDELRNEIDKHWKVIFTSYRHDNYPELVQHYNKMLSKNRLPKLNIDPILLGKGKKSGSMKEPKSAKDKPSKAKPNKGKCGSIVKNPLNPRNSKQFSKSPPPPAPSMTIPPSLLSPNSTAPPAPTMTMSRNDQIIANFVPPTNSLKLRNFCAPPLINSQEKTSKDWEITCDSLLRTIDTDLGKASGGPERDSKAPSIFWSKESVKYLNECINGVDAKEEFMERLQRVLKKSQSGLLSYNDYRAVIKIHNAIFKK